jgi:hypothetical protein
MYKLHCRNQPRWHSQLIKKGASKRYRARLLRQRAKPGPRRMRNNWNIFTPPTGKCRWPYSRIWRPKPWPKQSR